MTVKFSCRPTARQEEEMKPYSKRHLLKALKAWIAEGRDTRTLADLGSMYASENPPLSAADEETLDEILCQLDMTKEHGTQRIAFAVDYYIQLLSGDYKLTPAMLNVFSSLWDLVDFLKHEVSLDALKASLKPLRIPKELESWILNQDRRSALQIVTAPEKMVPLMDKLSRLESAR